MEEAKLSIRMVALIALCPITLCLAVPTNASAGAPTKLTVTQCAALGLRASDKILVKRVDLQEATAVIQQQRGEFFPRLGALLRFRKRVDASGSAYLQASGGTFDVTGLEYETSLSGLAPTGTTYKLALASNVQWTNLGAATLSPQHENSFTLALTQPLLKGWGVSTTMAKYEATKIDQRATSEEVHREASDSLIKVVKAYWDLVARQEEVAIAKKSLALAEKQRDATKVRVRARNLSRLDLIEAEAAIASRTQELLLAEESLLRSEKDLLLLVYRGHRGAKTIDITRRLDPVDVPRLEPLSKSLAELISEARASRSDLKALALRIKSQRVTSTAAENSTLPQLDLEVVAGGTSLAGTAVEGASPAAPIIGNHGTAWGRAFSFSQPFITASLKLDFPFSSDARRKEAQKQQFVLRRQKIEYVGLASRIAVEVRDAFLRVNNSTLRVKAAKEGEKLAEQNLDAAQKKFKGGLSTSYDVLRVQLALAQARRDLAQGLKEHMVAQAELHAAKGTLFSYLGITFR